MPTYEYECPGCSLHFELRQGFNADSSTPCPRCGKKAKRVFSVVPVFYKGSGFYCTDSGRSGSNPTMLPGNNGNKDTDKKDTDTTSKPEATASVDKE